MLKHDINTVFLYTITISLVCIGFAEVPGAMGQVTTSVTEPIEFSQIATLEPGVIQKIDVEEGQTIAVGQSLAQLDLGVLVESRNIAQLKSQSKSRVDATAAELKLRKVQKQNMDELIEMGHANPFEVEQAEATLDQAIAEHQGALEQQAEYLAEVARIDKEISRRTIRSPIAGTIVEIHKRPGEFVSANDPDFATIVRLDQLRVRFYLSADETESLRRGQSAIIYVGTQQTAIEGTIEFVSPVIEPKTGLARVHVIFDNRDMAVRSGVVCSWRQPLRLSQNLTTPRDWLRVRGNLPIEEVRK